MPSEARSPSSSSKVLCATNINPMFPPPHLPSWAGNGKTYRSGMHPLLQVWNSHKFAPSLRKLFKGKKGRRKRPRFIYFFDDTLTSCPPATRVSPKTLLFLSRETFLCRRNPLQPPSACRPATRGLPKSQPLCTKS